MPPLRACAALFALLAAGCASLGPPAATLAAPGEIAFRGTLVAASAPGDGSLVVEVRNDSTHVKDIAVRCMPAAIGRETVVRRQLTGSHQETRCDDTTCWVVDVPDYSEVETERVVPGAFSVTPSRLRIEPGQTVSVSVRLQNSSAVSEAFSLSLRVTVSDQEGGSELLVTCGSGLLLGQG
jgi:hypothetical protein